MDTQSLSVNLNLAGRELTIETGTLAKQATGAVTVSLGDTVVLATAVMNAKGKEGADFFPLTVDYEERFYASGKIKGSRFIKREGRPSENAILTSRIIDRPLRPLFPKGMTNEVQVICTVLSADLEVDPATTAMIGASAALMISGIPFEGPVASVRIGLITDSEGQEQLIVNPTYEQCDKGRLNMIIAGTMDNITMVEAGSIEVAEEKILEAIELAHKHIKKICALQKELMEKIKPNILPHDTNLLSDEVMNAVTKVITKKMADEVTGKTKAAVKEKVHALEDKLMAAYEKEIGEEVYSEKDLKNALGEYLEENMRSNILEKEVRLDGRALDEIRPIECKVGFLPRTHGSALFQRGETQAISITTLGAPGAAQIIDTMDEDEVRRYFHHYNFPPFSVGEARPLRGTGRREIGHGFLAERAVESMLPAKEDFPYTMRVVSEIVTCNGSSSMASVCGSSLSLMDAGVPIKKPVAGIAMGLITDKSGKYKILTDIQGMEDFAGDMDFKVAGTDSGINALQMDIKVKGLSIAIMKEALERAKKARLFLLEQMLKTLPEPRKQLSKYAPLIISFRIDTDQIRDVIGRGGETIQKIIAETGVEIDIEDDGLVMITSPNQENGQKALEWVKRITYTPNIGDSFEGTVVKIMDFGVFVEFVEGKDGLVHNSRLGGKHASQFKVGDPLKVKLIEIDDQGRYNLSAGDSPAGMGGAMPPPRRPMGRGGFGGGRR